MLARELRLRGFTARLVPQDGPPALEVGDSAAAARSATVIVQGGYFGWSWGYRIAEAGDVSTAAGTICRELAATPGDMEFLATAHPGHRFASEEVLAGECLVTRYVASGRTLDAHPYTVVTSDLGEMQAALDTGAGDGA